jgi:glycosyltransferase 2 family protein
MIDLIRQRGRAIWLRREWRSPVLIGTILLSLGLLIVGLVRGWQDLIQYQWRFDWMLLGLSTLAYSASLLLAMFGWSVIIRSLGAMSTRRQNAKIYLYSWMARRLPTPAPYLTSRVLLYEEIGVPKRLTGVGLLWENILLIASSAMLVVLLLPIVTIVSDRFPVIAVAAALAVGMLFVVHPRLLTWAVNLILRRFGKAPLEVGLRPSVTMYVLAIYASVWFAGGLILFFLIRTMFPLDWAVLPFVVQCWALSGLISYIVFFLPFSFGIREVSLAYLLSLAMPLSVAIVVVLLMRIWNLVNELLWAFVVYKL